MTNDIYYTQSIPTDPDTLTTESIEPALRPGVVCRRLRLRGIIFLTELIVRIVLLLLLLCPVRSGRRQVVGSLCLVIIILSLVPPVEHSTLDEGTA